MLFLAQTLVMIKEKSPNVNAHTQQIIAAMPSIKEMLDALNMDRSDLQYANVRLPPPGIPDAASQGLRGGRLHGRGERASVKP